MPGVMFDVGERLSDALKSIGKKLQVPVLN